MARRLKRASNFVSKAWRCFKKGIGQMRLPNGYLIIPGSFRELWATEDCPREDKADEGYRIPEITGKGWAQT